MRASEPVPRRRDDQERAGRGLRAGSARSAGRVGRCGLKLRAPPGALRQARPFDPEETMQKSDGKKKQKCKNCEGKGTLKKGDKVVRCQRCDGTGIKR